MGAPAVKYVATGPGLMLDEDDGAAEAGTPAGRLGVGIEVPPFMAQMPLTTVRVSGASHVSSERVERVWIRVGGARVCRAVGYCSWEEEGARSWAVACTTARAIGWYSRNRARAHAYLQTSDEERMGGKRTQVILDVAALLLNARGDVVGDFHDVLLLACMGSVAQVRHHLQRCQSSSSSSATRRRTKAGHVRERAAGAGHVLDEARQRALGQVADALGGGAEGEGGGGEEELHVCCC